MIPHSNYRHGLGSSLKGLGVTDKSNRMQTLELYMLANNLLEFDRLTNTCFDHYLKSQFRPAEHQSNIVHPFEPGSL